MRFERITSSIALAAVLFGMLILGAPLSAGAGSRDATGEQGLLRSW